MHQRHIQKLNVVFGYRDFPGNMTKVKFYERNIYSELNMRFFIVFFCVVCNFVFAQDADENNYPILKENISEKNIYLLLKLVDFSDVNTSYIYEKKSKNIQEKALLKAIKFWQSKENFQFEQDCGFFKNCKLELTPYIKIKLIEWYLDLDCTSIECLLYRYNVAFMSCSILYLPEKITSDDKKFLLHQKELLSKIEKKDFKQKCPENNKCLLRPLLLKKPIKLEYMEKVAVFESELSSYWPATGPAGADALISFLIDRYNSKPNLDLADVNFKTYQFQMYSGYRKHEFAKIDVIPESWYRD